MKFARRVDQIQPSQTLAITALVDSLRREGKDVVDLGAGEPDFDTPRVAREAGITAIEDGFTKYTPASGTMELKQAICDKLKRDNGLDFTPGQVVVTSGAKQALINVLLALCEKGDEVIVPSPYWTSYLEQVNFVDATPVVIETDDASGFKITPDQLQGAISPRTRVLILNSPSNPTGSVYTPSELADLAEVTRDHDFVILSDEIYEKIIYDGLQHHSPAQFSYLKDRVVVVNGASKAFSMTGWRIGYLAAPEPVVKAVMKIQSHSTSNACSISQRAATAALQAGDAILVDMIKAFEARRNYVYGEFSRLPGMTCVKPSGAFYLFPNVSGYFGKRAGNVRIENTIQFCKFLLEDARVALVPGDAFGSDQHIRLSYATSMDNLAEAIARISDALKTVED